MMYNKLSMHSNSKMLLSTTLSNNWTQH